MIRNFIYFLFCLSFIQSVNLNFYNLMFGNFLKKQNFENEKDNNLLDSSVEHYQSQSEDNTIPPDKSNYKVINGFKTTPLPKQQDKNSNKAELIIKPNFTDPKKLHSIVQGTQMNIPQKTVKKQQIQPKKQIVNKVVKLNLAPEAPSSDQQDEMNAENAKTGGYRFPVKLLTYPTIRDRQHFRELMKLEANGKDYYKKWSVDLRRAGKAPDGAVTIYTKCRISQGCPASIRYRVKDDAWELLNYSNEHNHAPPLGFYQAEKGKSKMSTAVAHEIDQIIAKTEHLPINKSFEAVNKQTGATEKEFIYAKLKRQSKCTLQMLTFLAKVLNYDIRTKMVNKGLVNALPSMFVIVSQSQKQSFSQYADIICFDIVSELIKDLSVDSKKYSVGIFSGHDTGRRSIIFGFAIISSENCENILDMFRMFVSMVEQTKIKAFITNDKEQTKLALDALKMEKNLKFNHIISSDHISISFQQSLSQIDDVHVKKSLGNLLNKTIKESNPLQGQQIMLQLKNQMYQRGLKAQYKTLFSKIESICLWKMPHSFVGLSFTSNEYLCNVLRGQFDKPTSLLSIIDALDALSHQRSNLCKPEKREYQKHCFEALFEDNRLNQVRLTLETNVFKTFIQNYRKSQFYKTVRMYQENFEIIHVFKEYGYKIHGYSCECGLFEKTGLPCQHLLYVLRNYYSESYMNFVEPRWISVEFRTTIPSKISEMLKLKEITIDEEEDIIKIS